MYSVWCVLESTHTHPLTTAPLHMYTMTCWTKLSSPSSTTMSPSHTHVRGTHHIYEPKEPWSGPSAVIRCALFRFLSLGSFVECVCVLMSHTKQLSLVAIQTISHFRISRVRCVHFLFRPLFYSLSGKCVRVHEVNLSKHISITPGTVYASHRDIPQKRCIYSVSNSKTRGKWYSTHIGEHNIIFSCTYTHFDMISNYIYKHFPFHRTVQSRDGLTVFRQWAGGGEGGGRGGGYHHHLHFRCVRRCSNLIPANTFAPLSRSAPYINAWTHNTHQHTMKFYNKYLFPCAPESYMVVHRREHTCTHLLYCAARATQSMWA